MYLIQFVFYMYRTFTYVIFLTFYNFIPTRFWEVSMGIYVQLELDALNVKCSVYHVRGEMKNVVWFEFIATGMLICESHECFFFFLLNRDDIEWENFFRRNLILFVVKMMNWKCIFICKCRTIFLLSRFR